MRTRVKHVWQLIVGDRIVGRDNTVRTVTYRHSEPTLARFAYATDFGPLEELDGAFLDQVFDVEVVDWWVERSRVLAAAREGRATCVPAGGRGNDVALVLIDGVVVGQASSLTHYVREEQPLTTSMHRERKLLPGYAHQIPRALGGTK